MYPGLRITPGNIITATHSSSTWQQEHDSIMTTPAANQTSITVTMTSTSAIVTVSEWPSASASTTNNSVTGANQTANQTNSTNQFPCHPARADSGANTAVISSKSKRSVATEKYHNAMTVTTYRIGQSGPTNRRANPIKPLSNTQQPQGGGVTLWITQKHKTVG